MYDTKVIISPARAYARATPAQRREWFPDGPPAGASAGPAGYGAGASWDADPAALAKAERAGMAALTAGYGSVLPDATMAPCGTCVPCQVGRPQECRRPLSKAEARLHAGQAVDADRARTSAAVAELGALYVELTAGLG
jgi:hypothetical protein